MPWNLGQIENPVPIDFMSKIYHTAKTCSDAQVMGQAVDSPEDPSQNLEGFISTILAQFGVSIPTTQQATHYPPKPSGKCPDAWSSITLAVSQLWKKLACCYGLDENTIRALNAASCALAITEVRTVKRQDNAVENKDWEVPKNKILEQTMKISAEHQQHPGSMPMHAGKELILCIK